MSNLNTILGVKGPRVWTIHQDATVLEASHLMNEHKIGALVVAEAGKIGGIFTERDVLRRVVCEQRNPAVTAVRDVMTRDLICATLETSIDEARTVMKERRIRHLPVVDQEGTLLGLVSIGDLNAWQTASQEQTIHTLEEYVYGRV